MKALQFVEKIMELMEEDKLTQGEVERVLKISFGRFLRNVLGKGKGFKIVEWHSLVCYDKAIEQLCCKAAGLPG